jgi:PIN domain nuclease of toxin-antitoxin system
LGNNELLIRYTPLIWWLSDDTILSPQARTAITDADNIIFVSAVTAWEITIKKALGKLDAPDNLDQEIINSRFEPLPITVLHALTVGKLPLHHKDPFDRLLIAQAQIEELTVITRDEHIRKYRVSYLLA